MINVLPPELKEQVRYSQRNVRLRRYIIVTLVVVSVLVASLIGAQWYAIAQIKEREKALQQRQATTTELVKVENEVKTVKTKLDFIEKLFNNSTGFSTLLNDLAAVLPNGAYINNITLTGDDKKPVQVLITVNSFNQAGVLRNALALSPRIASVDIVNVTKNTGSETYNVNLVIAFKVGQAR